MQDSCSIIEHRHCCVMSRSHGIRDAGDMMATWAMSQSQ
ncbi:hypothetical protein J3D54_004651 [Pseudomonas sp. GGS8]|nr:hypothetical protein [Pseudomonas sp. GGS8]